MYSRVVWQGVNGRFLAEADEGDLEDLTVTCTSTKLAFAPESYVSQNWSSTLDCPPVQVDKRLHRRYILSAVQIEREKGDAPGTCMMCVVR